MDVNPWYKYIEKFRGGVQWFMMESKDIASSISFKLKNENENLVSFNVQSITFRLSIKEIWFLNIWYCIFKLIEMLIIITLVLISYFIPTCF